MKNLLAITLVVLFSLQLSTASSQKSNCTHAAEKAKLAAVMVKSTENGCDIIFDLSNPAKGSKGERSIRNPLLFIVSALDNSISEVITAGDPAPMYKKRNQSATVSNQSVYAVWSSGNTINAITSSLVVQNGQFNIPPVTADGEYEVSVSWQWASAKNRSKSCTAYFTVSVQDGTCLSVKEKGTSQKALVAIDNKYN